MVELNQFHLEQELLKLYSKAPVKFEVNIIFYTPYFLLYVFSVIFIIYYIKVLFYFDENKIVPKKFDFMIHSK